MSSSPPSKPTVGPTAVVVTGTGNSLFGDTTYTKVFVGGLAWETHKETLKSYFLQFGDILEAVVITDKATSRSKGYGFVTFREPEAAMRACIDPSPVIDGRRANCNLAFLGAQKSKPSTPSHYTQHGISRNVKGMSNNSEDGYGATTYIGTASATTFPHYGIQQGIPLPHFYGYPPYSSDYTYPTTGYYGVQGGATTPYQMYGSTGAGAGGMMSCFYPYNLQFGDQSNAVTSYTTAGMQSYGLQYPQHPYQISSAAYPYQHYGAPMSFATGANPMHSGMNIALQAPIPHC